MGEKMDVTVVDRFTDFASLKIKSIAKDMDPGQQEKWMNNPSAFRKALANAMAPSWPLEIQQTAERWEKFYRDEFGLKSVDFSVVTIPVQRPALDRLMFIAKLLTPDWALAMCKNSFACASEIKHLHDFKGLSQREPYDHYAIWVKNSVEADEDLLMLSAADIKNLKISTETIVERIVHGHFFFKETGEHLDRKGATICSGTGDYYGLVPSVRWLNKKMYVQADSSVKAKFMGHREVVTLPA